MKLPRFGRLVVASSVALGAGLFAPIESISSGASNSPAIGFLVPGLKAISTSLNWSGMEATSSTSEFDSVGSKWTVPRVTCPHSGTTYSSMWVGLGGEHSGDTLFQTGIGMGCVKGAATYSAWWEYVPGNAAQYYSYVVRPGDIIYAGVSLVGGNQARFSLADYRPSGTMRWAAPYKLLPDVQAAKSAECILERPTVVINKKATYFPLANFGQAVFDNCTGSTQSDGVFALTPGAPVPAAKVGSLTMTNSSGDSLDQISNFQSIGGFTATWKRGS